MKIYTRTGDDGSTGLFGTQRVSKSDPRMDCIGTIDELNASLGVACVAAHETLAPWLLQVQNDLFVIGSHLATPAESSVAKHLPPLTEAMIDRLEGQIDNAEAELHPLHQFILPGGCEAAARLHLARTVCRRAERLLVAFATSEPVSSIMLKYLNRLSDWLFVMARLGNHRAGVEDVPWEKPIG